ncbi:hypothetical protein [Bacillus sp. 7894-2]|uniref:hypothetical protein n=1 Tax=Bacillus sp. 7894-2 TaxID=2021695 RepID=UPI000BA784BF|nr:hypothetical protein [Bacillus sp. 7894-2]PAE24746.1 hypothetical protein CHI10_11505 [Bacillus sp. 7894-2]
MSKNTDIVRGNNFEVLLPETTEDKKKELKNLIDQYEISDNRKKQIEDQAIKKNLTSTLLSNTGLLGKVVKFFKDTDDEVNKSQQQEKFDALIFDLITSQKVNNDTIQQIKELLLDPYGSMLFNKYSRILNNVPYYNEFIDLLGDALINISQEDYQEKYYDLDFLLTKIESLSPLALLLLTKLNDWQGETYNKTGDYKLIDNIVQGDWYTDFAAQYQSVLLKYGVSEKIELVNMHSRMALVIRELANEGLVIASGDGNKKRKEFTIGLSKPAFDILQLLKVK